MFVSFSFFERLWKIGIIFSSADGTSRSETVYFMSVPQLLKLRTCTYSDSQENALENHAGASRSETVYFMSVPQLPELRTCTYSDSREHALENHAVALLKLFRFGNIVSTRTPFPLDS